MKRGRVPEWPGVSGRKLNWPPEVCRNPWLLVTEPTTLFAIEMFGQFPEDPGLART